MKEIDFANCIGSECMYQDPLSNYLHTDGILKVAEENAAFWLINKVLSTIYHTKVLSKNSFLVVKLLQTKPDYAVVSFEDGNDNIIFTSEEFFTDFKFNRITNAFGSNDKTFMMFFENNTLMVPNER